MLFKIIVVVTILECATSAAAQSVQAEFRTPLEKGYKLEYFFKANWYTAYLVCRYHGLQLATIETKEQQAYVKQLILDHGYGNEFFWISGEDQHQENRFAWFSTGKNFKYTNWDVGQPDNFQGNENCVHIWTGQKWNDIVCTNQYFFICEQPEQPRNCQRSCC